MCATPVCGSMKAADVVPDGQTGRIIVDGEPGPAAVLGDAQLDRDANPHLGLIGPFQDDLAVSAAVFGLGPGTAGLRVPVVGIVWTVRAAVEELDVVLVRRAHRPEQS